MKAKLYAKKRHSEKVLMKRTIAEHSERTNKHKADEEVAKGAVPHYLLDREQARALSLRAGRSGLLWLAAGLGLNLFALNSASPRRPSGSMRNLYT